MLVTLQIGGNDIGFSSIAEDCVSLNPFGSPCKNQYTAGGVDQISQRIAETAPKVDAVLDDIRALSPNARVLVVNYSAIFPHTGNGCYPQMPVARGDVPYMRAKQEELNAMLAQQAAANGAGLVDVYAASVGHSACAAPGLRWVEPFVPANAAAPLHPNLLGMRAMADLRSLPCHPDIVDARLDQARGGGVGGGDRDPDRLAGERVERDWGRSPTRRCGWSPPRAAGTTVWPFTRTRKKSALLEFVPCARYDEKLRL